jgi:hypothetical protein
MAFTLATLGSATMLRHDPRYCARTAAMLPTLLFWLALLVPSARAAEQLRDEWEPIDRIVVSTLPNKALITYVENIVGEAVKAGVRVVVVDDDAASQAAIRKNLADRGLITDRTASYLQFTNTPHATGFARDEAVIVTFDSKTGIATLTATQFGDQSARVLADTAAALGLPKKDIPTVTLPRGFDPPSAPLAADGGDWMTTNGGKTLITTTNFYERNGGTDAAIKDSVNTTLRDAFGITKVIELEPLNEKAPGYDLNNSHADLQVRTLPGNKVIVASVPRDDPQHDILNRNAQKLKDAGFDVIRVENAPQAGTKAFKTYTNALFLNKTIIVPSYGDPALDEAARKAYDQALNNALPANDKKRYTIVTIDSSQIIQFCGAARCSAREIPKLPSKPEKREGSSKSPLVSFNSATGILSFTQDIINFLGLPGGELTDARFLGDALFGATIEIGDMVLQPSMTAEDRFAFVAGTLRLHKSGVDLFRASVPVFSIYGTHPPGTLDMFGVLHDIELAPPGTSPWLDLFELEVIDQPPLLPDFFISSSTDLIELSQGFTRSFAGVQLGRAGIVGNGAAVSEPGSLCLMILVLTLLCALRLQSLEGFGKRQFSRRV